jgi:hypothetical protein
VIYNRSIIDGLSGIATKIIHVPDRSASVFLIETAIFSVALLLQVDLFFDDGSSQTLQEEMLLFLELFLTFCSEFIFGESFGGSSLDLVFYLILEFVKMILEILLLLLQEPVLPLPKVATTQLFSCLGFLLFFPLLNRIAHDFNHCHLSAIGLSSTEFCDPGEATCQTLLCEAWCDLSIEFLHASIGEQRLLQVSLASVVLNPKLRFPHETLNPRAELLGFMQRRDDPFVRH